MVNPILININVTIFVDRQKQAMYRQNYSNKKKNPVVSCNKIAYFYVL